jgi:type IV fimbrial biogenesis protein FimT
MVLAVAGILTATAAPAMQSVVYEQRLTAYVNELLGDLQLARSEAIRRAASVTLCKSNTGQACTTDSDWHEGWLLFSDENENGRIDAGESILRIRQSLEGRVTLAFGAFGPGSGRYITYQSTGMSRQNGTFTFCGARGAGSARAVIVSSGGRARISDKSSSGGALRCS